MGNQIDSAQPQFTLNDIAFTLNSNAYVLFPAMLSTYSNAAYGHWKDGITDHYLGVKFSDGANEFFGWARCDVSADALSITIKDYAYNSIPNTGLFAGQGDPTGIGSANPAVNFSVFGYEGIASIFVNDSKFDGASVTVTNILGQTMVRQNLSNRTTRIDLNQFGKGIYLVTIHRGNESFSRKVSFR